MSKALSNSSVIVDKPKANTAQNIYNKWIKSPPKEDRSMTPRQIKLEQNKSSSVFQSIDTRNTMNTSMGIRDSGVRDSHQSGKPLQKPLFAKAANQSVMYGNHHRKQSQSQLM